MLVQMAARSCRSTTTACRTVNAQGKRGQAERTKVAGQGRVRRCVQRAAGVVGRRVEVAGCGERSPMGGQERGGRAAVQVGAGGIGESSNYARKETVVGFGVRASQQCDRYAGAPRRIIVES